MRSRKAFGRYFARPPKTQLKDPSLPRSFFQNKEETAIRQCAGFTEIPSKMRKEGQDDHGRLRLKELGGPPGFFTVLFGLCS